MPQPGSKIPCMLQLRPGSAKLLSLRAAPTEAHAPRAHALLQEKPPQREACAPQWREPQRTAAGEILWIAMKTQGNQKVKKKKRIVYIISNCIVNEGPLSPCGYLHLHSLKLNTIWKSISQLMAAFQGVDSPWLVAVKELPRWLSGKESACQCRRHGSRGEEEMATHSGILAWKIPWTKEPGELQFMCSQRVRHDWAQMW